MTNAINDALPWHNSAKREDTTTSETTAGGQESTRWVVIAEHLNPAEAAVIKSRLESEDIPAVVQRKESSIFAITVGPMGSNKVLVPESLAERALSILSVVFETDESWDETGIADEQFEDDPE